MYRRISMRKPFAATVSAALLGTSLLIPLQADEGMWLFNRPPNELLKSKYGFEATHDWLEHVQQSSVRFNNGGSRGFVFGDGLVIDKHHQRNDCLHKNRSTSPAYIT